MLGVIKVIRFRCQFNRSSGVIEDPSLNMSTCYAEMRLSSKPSDSLVSPSLYNEPASHGLFNGPSPWTQSFHPAEVGGEMRNKKLFNDFLDRKQMMASLLDTDETSADTMNAAYAPLSNSNFMPTMPQLPRAYSYQYFANDSPSDPRRSSGSTSASNSYSHPNMMRSRVSTSHGSNFFLNSPAMHPDIVNSNSSNRTNNSKRRHDHRLRQPNPMYTGTPFTLPSWDTIKEHRLLGEQQKQQGQHRAGVEFNPPPNTFLDIYGWPPRPHR